MRAVSRPLPRDALGPRRMCPEDGLTQEEDGQEEAVEDCCDEQVEFTAEVFRRLLRERRALFHELCGMKAKFELTLETFRSILRLGCDTTWADLLEAAEALAERGLGAAGGLAHSSIPLTASEADLERERLEENLEAQTAYNARLREILQKQQQLLDMTAQQLESQQEQGKAQEMWALAQERREAEQRVEQIEGECEALQEQLAHQQEAMVQQEMLISRQARRLKELEEELERSHAQLATRAAEGRQQQAEEQCAWCSRQLAEVRDLAERLAQQEDLVERLRAQLQVYEAAERRRYSYHPSGRCTSDDGSSEYGSSVGSTRPSARGPGPRASGEHDGVRSRGNSAGAPAKQLSRPIEDMDMEERAAFLSHFPMASRTERHMRNRLDDKKKKTLGNPMPLAS